jgi:hypothetical protein
VDTKRLIDAIVHQTTILIAQISTAAGIRSPLAHVADRVFLELSRELEAQGVTRKVAADMFGLALRSYQKKIQRLAESATYRDRTLWGAVVEHLRATGGTGRQALLKHFSREDAHDLAAVLKDLVSTGFVSSTGRGASTYYELASAQARQAVADDAELDTVTNLVWLAVYDHQQVERTALLAGLPFGAELSARAVDALIDDGRIERARGAAGEELLRCTTLVIPVGAERGWEAAVFDHFRAMATAIATKLRKAGAKSRDGDVVGGSTLSFNIERDHPFEAQVYGLLRRVRADANALWNQVTEYNAAHPVDSDTRVEVTFYFGQTVTGEDPIALETENDDET